MFFKYGFIMEDIVVIIITFNWDARFEQATVLQFQFRQFWNIQNCPLSLTYTCNLHFVCNIPFLKICCEKEIAQWSINDSSIQNHSTMKCGKCIYQIGMWVEIWSEGWSIYSNVHSLICIYSQATRNVGFGQENKSTLSFPFNSRCIYC